MSDGMTILVVEDDPDIRDTLRQVLEDCGFVVATAVNGRDALDALHDHRTDPCLILLDLMMPVMSGSEFLGAVHQDEQLHGIPVIVVSAALPEANGGWRRQCAGYVRKPVEIGQLIAQIDRVCPGIRRPDAPAGP